MVIPANWYRAISTAGHAIPLLDGNNTWSGTATFAGPVVFSGGIVGFVSSVALSLPPIFSVSGSPIVNSGTLVGSLVAQLPNLVWASSSSGATAAPTFRAIARADLPVDTITAKTTNYTIAAADNAIIFANTGAAGTVTLSLPTGSSGLKYGFYVAAAQDMKILAAAGATINFGTAVSGTAGFLSSALVGSYVAVQGLSSTSWFSTTSQGEWTVT